MSDFLSEFTYGPGAVKVDGKWIFRDMSRDSDSYRITAVCGLIATPRNFPLCQFLNPDAKGKDYRQEELWLGQTIMLPTDKYHGTLLRGQSLGGIFTGSYFDPRMEGWERHFPVDTAVQERLEEACRKPEEE